MRKRTAFFVGAAGIRIIATASVRTGCGNDRVTQEVRWGGRTEASAPTKMCCRGGSTPPTGAKPLPYALLVTQYRKKETPAGVSFFM